MTQEYVSQGHFSENSTVHAAWLRFTLLLVIINAVVKVVLDEFRRSSF